MAQAYASANKIGPENVPSNEEIQAEADQLDAGNTTAALKDWEAAQKNSPLNQVGEMDDKQSAVWDRTRKAIAKAHMIDPNALPPVPTGQSLKRQFQDQRIAQMKTNETDRVSLANQNIVLRGASIDLAAQRFQYAQEHGNAILAKDQARMGLAQTTEFNKGVREKIKSIETEQKSVISVLNNSNTHKTLTETQRNSIQTRYQELADEKDKLTKQLVDPAVFKPAAMPEIQTFNPLQGPIGASLRPMPAKKTTYKPGPVRGARTGAIFQFKP